MILGVAIEYNNIDFEFVKKGVGQRLNILIPRCKKRPVLVRH